MGDPPPACRWRPSGRPPSAGPRICSRSVTSRATTTRKSAAGLAHLAQPELGREEPPAPGAEAGLQDELRGPPARPARPPRRRRSAAAGSRSVVQGAPMQLRRGPGRAAGWPSRWRPRSAPTASRAGRWPRRSRRAGYGSAPARRPAPAGPGSSSCAVERSPMPRSRSSTSARPPASSKRELIEPLDLARCRAAWVGGEAGVPGGALGQGRQVGAPARRPGAAAPPARWPRRRPAGAPPARPRPVGRPLAEVQPQGRPEPPVARRRALEVPGHHLGQDRGDGLAVRQVEAARPARGPWRGPRPGWRWRRPGRRRGSPPASGPAPPGRPAPPWPSARTPA